MRIFNFPVISSTFFGTALSFGSLTVPLSSLQSTFVTQSRSLSSSKSRIFSTSTTSDDKQKRNEENIECYVIDGMYIGPDREDQVVCTSEPEEYAWFNGIDPKALSKTEGAKTDGEIGYDAMECVEGSSPRGIPEW
eukprot:CAMPEP_0113307758 /NCGR_PEP_ID=MMETSP0010_2-20120614/6478_1 /TAXON_ID=216773 ORGANISM="Corethron hystrix, Strain 308" /NCGR_SAMPLE_ID=MMETSP0010_2 /ASSEMBLY_ACC=CAM_ASM_000155 /LENGTH=135 /DNA_ID=CAMNT_0000162683 /DNA_START=196 /DNA_END=600 /DNA_ORIENTATION=- /assembly_acc=CAM_ASM_000155